MISGFGGICGTPAVLQVCASGEVRRVRAAGQRGEPSARLVRAPRATSPLLVRMAKCVRHVVRGAIPRLATPRLAREALILQVALRVAVADLGSPPCRYSAARLCAVSLWHKIARERCISCSVKVFAGERGTTGRRLSPVSSRAPLPRPRPPSGRLGADTE